MTECVENVESEALGGSRQVVSYWQNSEILKLPLKLSSGGSIDI